MAEVRAVLFDLDGTLLDRKLAYERFMLDQGLRFLADLPCESPRAYLEAAVRLDRNGMAPRREVFAQMARDLDLGDELTQRLMSDYGQKFPASCTLFPGVNELLETLRSSGIRLGLVTNGSASIQGGKLDAVQLRTRLDTVLISEVEGLRKPDAAIFRLAAARLEAAASQCVFVGDNPDADVRGAKASGMRAVWVRDSWWEEPAEADAVIDEVHELVPLVEAWRA